MNTVVRIFLSALIVCLATSSSAAISASTTSSSSKSGSFGRQLRAAEAEVAADEKMSEASVTLASIESSTVAGTAQSPGFSGDSGAATSATLNFPTNVAVDGSGNLYISDFFNNRIRFVSSSTNVITTYVGSGSVGYTGDGGPATSANIFNPTYLALDSSGNLYFTAYGVIRLVTKSTSIISTAISSNCPVGLAVDSSNNLYMSDSCNNVVYVLTVSTNTLSLYAGVKGYGAYSGDGGAATSANFNFPSGLTMDSSNNLYVSDMLNHRIRVINASTGIVSTIVGTGTAGYTGDGGAATSATISYVYGIDVDSSGNVYLADTNENVVRLVTASTGIISTYAGTGVAGYSGSGVATSSQLNSPFEVTCGTGVVYIADSSNDIIVATK